MSLLGRLVKLSRDLVGWRDLDYTSRQILLRKVFSVPFLAVLPVMLAAGLLLRLVRRRLDKALCKRDLA
ncbi:MAG: hypothetical protein V1748_01650 [Actinomycetota bacterium]